MEISPDTKPQNARELAIESLVINLPRKGESKMGLGRLSLVLFGHISVAFCLFWSPQTDLSLFCLSGFASSLWWSGDVNLFKILAQNRSDSDRCEFSLAGWL